MDSDINKETNTCTQHRNTRGHTQNARYFSIQVGLVEVNFESYELHKTDVLQKNRPSILHAYQIPVHSPGKKVEIIGYPVNMDSMSSIVSSLLGVG